MEWPDPDEPDGLYSPPPPDPGDYDISPASQDGDAAPAPDPSPMRSERVRLEELFAEDVAGRGPGDDAPPTAPAPKLKLTIKRPRTGHAAAYVNAPDRASGPAGGCGPSGPAPEPSSGVSHVRQSVPKRIVAAKPQVCERWTEGRLWFFMGWKLRNPRRLSNATR